MQVAYVLNQLLNAYVGVDGELYVPYNLVSQYLKEWQKSCISWDIENFQQAAIWEKGVDWAIIYDASWFEQALHCMIKEHDAGTGINYDTVYHYLNKYCKRDSENSPIELEADLLSAG